MTYLHVYKNKIPHTYCVKPFNQLILQYNKQLMTQHYSEEEVKVTPESVYYIVGILSGMFVGLILESGFIWIPVLGIFGLLFTKFFRSVFVKGHGDY